MGATLRVYAIWNSTITFDANDGILHPSTVSPIVARAGSLFGGILPTPTNAPTRVNHVFAGWNTAADGSGTEITPTTPVGASTTLYAQWTPVVTYTVTFNLNGGTQAVGESPALLSQNVQQGGNATMIANPTLTGYNFVSWAVNPEGATVINVQENITFTAQWAQIILPTLTGTVTCDETDNFIPDVTIRLYENVSDIWQYLRSQQTNADGVFNFGEVPVGNLRVIMDYGTIPEGHVVTLGGNRYITAVPAEVYVEHFRIAPAPPPDETPPDETPPDETPPDETPPHDTPQQPPTTREVSPRTGDTMDIILGYVGLMGMAIGFLMMLSFITRKKRRD
jgi:uncharacterized repeat protein (TIGR02543 family)/LPXTG-motif cell wall-anchored protein